MRGKQAIERVAQYGDVHTVLDIGSWRGEQAQYLRSKGKKVSTVDFNAKADYQGDFLKLEFDQQFDCVWCSHTLEHQPNVGQFLDKCSRVLRDGGLLAITVPSMDKYERRVVDGHLTYWNAGVLLYNMVVAGFNCSKARVSTYDKQVSVLVTKKKADLPTLTGDRGELERLNKFFPLQIKQGFDGYIEKLNW
jgi:SAM-dependent methyltransferase